MLGSPLRMAAGAAAVLIVSTPVLAQRGPLPIAAVSGQVPAASPSQPPARRLSLDEAVRLALEQNLQIKIARLDPQIQDVAVAQARASWSPALSTTFTRNAQSQPAQSAIVPTSQNATFATGVGVAQTLPWGGHYSVDWNNERQTTTNILSDFSPLLLSTTNLSYTQPLLRNFSIDQIREQLAISQKRRDLSDIDVRGVVAEISRRVESAYWDLVYANDNVAVQRQALDLSRQSLGENQQRVANGTMARVDIVQDEAEVAANQQNVIIAEGAVASAQNRLRVLIFDPSTPDVWSIALEPSDAAPFDDRPVDVTAAVARALQDRTDLQQARNAVDQNAVALRFSRNQILPDVSLVLNYGTFGVGGTELTPVDLSSASNVLPSSRSIVSERGYGSVLGDVFAGAYPQWTIGVQIGYQLSTSLARANLARAQLEADQTQLRVKDLEMQATLQVREAAQQVETNQKRVVAARASTALQREKLEAEQRKVAAGTSVPFFVIQAERDLAQAQTLETRALLDYEKARVDFDAIQEVPPPGVGDSTAADTLPVAAGIRR